MRIEEFRSNEWCHDNKARTQEQLQVMAGKIRKSCKVTQICDNGSSIVTIYENENLGLKYWIHDSFGNISEIIEGRSY